jgi:hypothetical protein
MCALPEFVCNLFGLSFHNLLAQKSTAKDTMQRRRLFVLVCSVPKTNVMQYENRQTPPPQGTQRAGRRGCRLDKGGERDLVLADVGREVRVLEEDVADEPLGRTADLARGYAGDAVAAEVVRVDGRELEVDGVDRERLPAERERDARVRGARHGEAALAIRLGTGDQLVHGRGVAGRRNDKRGAGVEDGGAAVESGVRAVDGDGAEGALPEALRVDVVEGDERVGVELGGVETAEGDLAIVLLVGETRDLVRYDRVVDQACLGKRLGRGEDTLFRESLRDSSASAMITPRKIAD